MDQNFDFNRAIMNSPLNIDSRVVEAVSAKANYEAAKDNAIFETSEYLQNLNEKVRELSDQLSAIQGGRKHEMRNNILLSIFSAFVGGIIGTICTVLATETGWL